ncbi:hypothetical protein ACHHYP_09981 [Achlya hypogyna]|uniref:Uncharacterized protein n=1 Tax=Achlya hypogyna TaxID=1202772 RepID=A0A1V9YM22_ACHHY|nr:hypothetical protein ACHHYP_09981 [Achlya hypogyna]
MADVQFFVPNCEHTALFQPCYVRCQKSQGQKILRCFPHCCPHHIHYRNCGSAICLAVTPHGDPSALRALAAFTLLDEELFRVDTVVAAQDLAGGVRAPENIFGEFVEGQRLPVDGRQRHFRFDDKQVDGWHYAWKSGRSKVQRELQHVLRAYVFEAIDDKHWRCIGSTASTPFTIVSYRGEHNKKKRAIAAQLPTSPASPPPTPPHGDVDDMHYMTILTSLQDVMLEDVPAPLLPWLHDQFPHLLPHLQGGVTDKRYIQVYVALALALGHPDFLKRVDDVLIVNAEAVLHKGDLQRVYYECLCEQLFFPVVEAALRRHGVIAADVASSVAQVRGRAPGDSFFQRFVAQMRESFILTQSPSALTVLSACRHSIVDGTWVLQPEATRVRHWMCPTPLLQYLRLCHNTVTMVQRYVHGSLYVRASPSSFSTVPSEFVLDDHAHSLRVLPAGESCLVDLGVDYVGAFGPDGALRLALLLFERSSISCLVANIVGTYVDGQTLIYTVDLHMTSAPSPEVFSGDMKHDCHFFVPQCPHGDSVFRPNYVRCQKTQGQKILRCFPHCCPGHVHYRNCGTSLYVSTPPRSPVTQPAVHVVGRFSLHDDNPYAVGTLLDAEMVRHQLRSRDNPYGDLIPATRTAWGQFRFDEKQVDGWQYSWKSGRSKAQRDLLHVFRAYVLEPQSPSVWRVIADAVSSPFTIVSYRGEYNKRKRDLESPSAPTPPLTDPTTDVATLLRYMRTLTVDRLLQDALPAVVGTCPFLPNSSSRPRPWHDHVCTAIALVLARPTFLAQLDACLVSHAAAVLSKPELHRIYEHFFAHVLCPAVESAAADFGTTVAQLAAAVDDMELPPNDYMPRFVAQMREAYIVSQSPPSYQPSGNSIFNGTWHRRDSDVYQPYARRVALSHYLRWLGIVKAFTLRFHAYDHTLHMRSETPRFSAVPAEFVLDGNGHRLRVLPDGESCLGLIAVDYTGTLSSSGEVFLTLYLSERGGTSCLIADVVLVPHPDQTLVASVSIQAAVARNGAQDVFDCEATQRIDELLSWPAALVAAFDVTYAHETPPSGLRTSSSVQSALQPTITSHPFR